MNTTPPANADPTAHTHDATCFWDHLNARRSCAGPTTRTAPSALVDVRDMLVVHTALLREFRLAPDAVERVEPGDRRQVRRVDEHLQLLCDLMHHHHTGEDELLWPVLAPRLAASERALVGVAEAQHAGIETALEAVEAGRRTWRESADEPTRAALAQALRTLHGLLAEHLEAEERLLLPLAAAHLSEREWRAIGEAGAASVPKPQLMLVFGMFAYEGDPVVLKQMLSEAPPPARLLVPRLAPRAYARHAARVHGTRTP